MVSFLRRSLKYLVPFLVIVLAHELSKEQQLSVEVIKNLWIKTYDKVAEASDWLDSFLPESVYSDENIWETNSEDENAQRPVLYKPAVENGSESNVEAKTYFSSSMRPRRWRTSNILYRVGELIYHHTMNLYCVIVGWDKTAKAPTDWLDKVYKGSKEVKRKQVHYMSICTSETNSEENIFTYLSQDEVTKIDSIPEHMQLKLIFLQSHFDIKTESEFEQMRSPYPLRPWLKKIYPAD